MRRLLCLGLYINLLGTLNAQQIYFNERIDFGRSSLTNAYDIIQTDTGYTVIISTNDTVGLYGTSKIALAFLGTLGNLKSVTIASVYNSGISIGGYGSLVKLSDNNLILFGSITDSVGNANAMLFKFNSMGDTIWTHEYGDTAFQSGRGVRQTRDGGYILTGQTCSYDVNGDVLLIKTDSNGVEQWEKHYGGSYYDLGLAIDTCFDGGFIIAGYTQSYGSINGNGKIYILKTDSLGKLQWYRVFGSQYDAGAWSCLQSSDSSFVIGGYFSSEQSISQAYIIKLNTKGNTIWTKAYGPIDNSAGLFSIKELLNGDLISSGIFQDTTLGTNRFKGLILKTNSQGDSLWYRTYLNAVAPLSDNLLFDVIPTSDLGFIACGIVGPQTPDTIAGVEYAWILKLDSSGCEVANCIVNGVEEIVSNNKEELLQNYPNPFNSSTTIEASVSENVKAASVSIHDYLGKELMLFKLTNGLNKFNVSSNQLSNGMYFYSLIEDGKTIVTHKMVVMQ